MIKVLILILVLLLIKQNIQVPITLMQSYYSVKIIESALFNFMVLSSGLLFTLDYLALDRGLLFLKVKNCYKNLIVADGVLLLGACDSSP